MKKSLLLLLVLGLVGQVVAMDNPSAPVENLESAVASSDSMPIVDAAAGDVASAADRLKELEVAGSSRGAGADQAVGDVEEEPADAVDGEESADAADGEVAVDAEAAAEEDGAQS